MATGYGDGLCAGDQALARRMVSYTCVLANMDKLHTKEVQIVSYLVHSNVIVSLQAFLQQYDDCNRDITSGTAIFKTILIVFALKLILHEPTSHTIESVTCYKQGRGRAATRML